MGGLRRVKQTERLALAEGLARRMSETYRDQLLLAGVYGSTARGTDTPWSDVEMLFVVEDGCVAQGTHLLFRDIVVGYRVCRRGELEEILRVPSRRWPFHMGVLSVLQVLQGDETEVRNWLRLGQSVPEADFRTALREALPDMVHEAYGRVMSCMERGNSRDVPHVAIEIIYEMRDSLCLLNRSWVTHDYWAGIEDSFAFAKLPESYERLMRALWDARDLDATVDLSTELVGNWKALLEQEGALPSVYEQVEHIPV
jgi:predicted nucleotidyltransferase